MNRKIKAMAGKAGKQSRLRSLTSAGANQVDAQVEYHKSEQTSFRIMTEDVATRSKQHKSFDLLWRVPGYGDSAVPEVTGIACDIGQAHYELENVSDFVLYIRMQRPLGYKEAPSSYAMWEPISQHATDIVIELKPHEKRRYSVANTGTSYMTPRHINNDGLVFCHLLSISLYRDALNYHGNSVEPVGVVLVVNVDLRFRVNDGQVGPQKGFCVNMFPDSVHMDQVDVGPAITVRVDDLSFRDDKGKEHPCDLLRWKVDRSRVKLEGVRFIKDFHNGSPAFITSYDLTLDRSTGWKVPPVLAYLGNGGVKEKEPTVCTCIEYDLASGAFVLGKYCAMVNGGSMTTTLVEAVDCPMPKFASGFVVYPSENLSPITKSKAPKTVVYKKRKPKKVLQASSTSDSPYLLQYQDTGIETILDSIVVIVDVIRVIASFAAAIGFLEKSNNVVGGSSVT